MRLAACTLGLCALPLAANAHHSRVEFSDEVLELEGQLTELVWLNPHPALFLELENETGEPETWRVEGHTGVRVYNRMGVTPDLFTIGDTIRVPGARPLGATGTSLEPTCCWRMKRKCASAGTTPRTGPPEP